MGARHSSPAQNEEQRASAPKPAAATPASQQPVGASLRDDQHKLANRMVVCGLAIALLWSTSLSVSVHVVQRLITTPSYKDIYDTCEYAYDVTAEEKDAYQQCTDRQLRQCELDFEAANAKEEQRVTAAFAHNAQILAAAESAHSSCTQAVISAQKALDAWSTTGAIQYSGECSEQEMNDVNRIVGSEGALRSATYSLAENFATTSTQRVRHLSEYAVQRQQYDWAYLINKTSSLQTQVSAVVESVSMPNLTAINASFAQLQASVRRITECASAETGACHFGPDVAAAYLAVVDQVSVWMEIAEQTVDALTTEAQRFQGDVRDMQETMVQFITLAQKTWQAIKSLDEASFFSASQLNALNYKAWGPNLFSLEDVIVESFVFPRPLIAKPGLTAAEEVVAPLRSALQLTNMGILNASVVTALVAREWYADLRQQMAGVTFSPADYDPPVYRSLEGAPNVTVVVEAAQQEVEAEEFKANTAVSLQAYAELTRSNSSSETFGSLNMTKADFGAKFSNYFFTFEPMSAPDYDVELWIVKLGTISSYLFVFDLLVRAIHTIALIYSYWNKSAVRLPEADLRKRHHASGSPWLSAASGAAMSFIGSVSFCVLVAVAFVVLLAVVVAAAYIPIYDSYVAACVTHTQNDTFLTSNLYSIAYNYASEDGNNNALQGVQDYNVMQTDYCSTYGSSTQTQQRQDEITFSGFLTAQQQTVHMAELLSKCIDVPSMDAAFQRACCGAEGYAACEVGMAPNGSCPTSVSSGVPYSPLSEYLDQTACSTDLFAYKIKDGTFQCSALPACTLTCEGPNQQLLDTVTKQCGCMLEWAVHSGFFQIAIAAVVFALINLARLLVMRGILMLNWRKLAPGVFVYQANCTEHGAILRPAKGKNDTNYAELLKQRLQAQIRGLKCKGVCYILLGIVINLPWMAFLYLIADTVEYQPSE